MNVVDGASNGFRMQLIANIQISFSSSVSALNKNSCLSVIIDYDDFLFTNENSGYSVNLIMFIFSTSSVGDVYDFSFLYVANFDMVRTLHRLLFVKEITFAMLQDDVISYKANFLE